jgi:two-component system sensor histidine kinase KdpD
MLSKDRGVDRSRGLAGAALGVGLVVVLSGALVGVRSDIRPTTPALLLVLPVGFAAVVGGRWPAVVTAVAAAVAYNLGFIRPFGTMKVDHPDDVVALAVFLAVAVVTGALVARASERTRAAEQRTRDVEALNARSEHVMAERERLAEETNRLQVLERVDEQRSALLQSLSHDLRTPLAAIKAVASDLRDGAVYDEATRATLLDSVVTETERLDRLVANLLSMSRIEAGALAPDRQAVDVEELIRERVQRLGGLFDGVRLQVEIAPDMPLVDGDYTQLEQVVTNLLENAARYAPARSTVTVGARAPSPSTVEITVADEGIGVPPHESRRIFEPFHRGEGSRSSGVGLAIAKAVVEAHGGAIEVLRTPGGGATFVVTLPARDG